MSQVFKINKTRDVNSVFEAEKGCDTCKGHLKMLKQKHNGNRSRRERGKRLDCDVCDNEGTLSCEKAECIHKGKGFIGSHPWSCTHEKACTNAFCKWTRRCNKCGSIVAPRAQKCSNVYCDNRTLNPTKSAKWYYD